MQLLRGPKTEHKVEFCMLLLNVEKLKKHKMLGRILEIYSLINFTFINKKYLRLSLVRQFAQSDRTN